MLMVPAVLVVDDDVSTQSLLAAVVRYYGLTPLSAGDGREALAMIAEHSPAAIILDLLMPEVDGFEVLRRLRKTRPEMLAQVIVVTAAAYTMMGQCDELDLVWKLFRKPLEIDDLGRSMLECVRASSNKTGRDGVYETPSQP